MSYLIERLRQLDRLDALIRRKATGNREELAERLGVSVRTITNLKQELEDFGAEICYDRGRGSYVYRNRVLFDWNIVIEVENLDRLRGGQKIILECCWGQNTCTNKGDFRDTYQIPTLD